MIERDDNFPPFGELLAELEHARMAQAEVLSQQRESAA
jgi:gas vesicle GvpC-like protein